MHNLSRRRILKIAAATPLLGSIGPSKAATQSGPPSGPTELLATYRKMRFALHDRPVFWWMRATKYGLVDGKLTPLYGMEIGNISKVVASDSDSFTAKTLEIVYSTDGETGELLDEWVNPYTGVTLPMHNIPIGPNSLNHTVEGPELPTELPGAKLDASAEFGPLWSEGGSVWIRDDTSALVTQLDGKSKPFRVYDWPTYQSSLADLQNPNLDSARCNVSFTAVSDWQRWMSMQDRPGNLMSRASGQKADHFDQLPERFRRLLAEHHPIIFEDPEKALDLPPFRFER